MSQDGGDGDHAMRDARRAATGDQDLSDQEVSGIEASIDAGSKVVLHLLQDVEDADDSPDLDLDARERDTRDTVLLDLKRQGVGSTPVLEFAEPHSAAYALSYFSDPMSVGQELGMGGAAPAALADVAGSGMDSSEDSTHGGSGGIMSPPSAEFMPMYKPGRGLDYR